MTTALLQGKSAIVYGAGGGVGRFVSKAFAREGATVFLAGRTESTLESVAKEISQAGGVSHVAIVDALDAPSIKKHLHEVVAKAGKLDVSFNLISAGVGMGKALTELTDEQFVKSTSTLVRSNFLTATAAARQMEKQGSGVILFLTAVSARVPRPKGGGFTIVGGALEALCKQLAVDVGPRGVRVVGLRTGGTPDNPVLQEVYAELARVGGVPIEEVEKSEAQRTALQRLPLLREVADTAALMASDYASAITATVVNVSSGEILD